MLNNALRISRIILGEKKSITRDEIESCVDEILKMDGFKSIDRAQLIAHIESMYSVRVEDYRIIAPEDRNKPWLNEVITKTNRSFWERYETYLKDDEKYAPDVINKLDRLTDRILDSLFNPKENIEIDKKGLVVGQVQSGKNFKLYWTYM